MDKKTLNNIAAPKRHQKYKKVLIIGGIVVVVTTAAIITYVVLRRKSTLIARTADVVANSLSTESIVSICEKADQAIKRAHPTSPVFVSSGIRKFPNGYHASENQLKLAQSLGVIVPEGYTFVKEHTKYNFLLDCA